MTNADRLIKWNQWFDATPEAWRAHIVLWPLVIAGFLNMQLTIAGGFPFGVLVLLAIAAMAAVRLPYLMDWIVPQPEGAAEGARFEFGRFDALYEANRRYDALPEQRRLWVVPAILIVAGTLNMWLTAARGWAFASLVLVVLLALVVIRVPYAWKLIAPPAEQREGSMMAGWLSGINNWYDELPPQRRFWTVMVALAVVFIIDLRLVAGAGLSLGVVFLLDLLVVVALRAPYVAGALSLPPRRAPALTSPAPAPTLAIEQQHNMTTIDPATVPEHAAQHG